MQPNQLADLKALVGEWTRAGGLPADLGGVYGSADVPFRLR
jgi:hypothetical protein